MDFEPNRYQKAFQRARKAYAAHVKRDVEELSEKARRRHVRRELASRRRMIESARFADDMAAIDCEAV